MDDLFAELKPDVEALAEPLLSASEVFVRERGGFLPHGAVLEAGHEVRLVMASPDRVDARASAADVLPRLHEALRGDAQQRDLVAVAVCEDVTITPSGQKSTKAIKVLVEHRRGLTVALYLPWKRKLLGGHVFGEMMVLAAAPEVRAWSSTA
ncbi:MAG: hypothetical protein IAG13_14965 [Deltaproteobacteria bacterium]|nr:hypothetical protein [Nannocystaceae bacterium]